MIKVCKYCNEEFETDDKRKKFCNMKCYKANTKEKNTKKCENCGKEFIGKKNQKCCSRKCSGEIQRQRVSVKCSWCNTTLEKFKSQAKRSVDHYCSQECKSNHCKEKFNGSSNPNWKGLTFKTKCDNCGKAFIYSDYYGAQYNYCSQVCKGEHQKETLIGEDNPNYKQDKSDYLRIKERSYAGYGDWRIAVFERDKYNCIRCGTNTTTDNKIVAHHIINHYSYPEGRLDVDNGLTLCSKCHWQFHRIYGTMHNDAKQIEEFLKQSREG